MSDKTHQRYYQTASRLLDTLPPRSLILKTDAWNEACDATLCKPEHEFVYLEIDPAIVNRARERCPGFNIIQGDIRKIPFVSDLFDAVLDFSTLDHVPDYEAALDEYRRVLKPGGHLLLFVWLTNIPVEPMNEGYGQQHFFERTAFSDRIVERFDTQMLIECPETHGCDWLRGLPGRRFLQGYHCTK